LIGDPVVSDRSAEAHSWLTTEQDLLGRYEFMKALAQAPVTAGGQRPAANQETAK